MDKQFFKILTMSLCHSVAGGLFLLVFLFAGCKKGYVPKPYGYPRIERDTASYRLFNSPEFPLQFDIAAEADAVLRGNATSAVWLDISYPDYGATLYCTYLPVSGKDIDEELSKATEFVYLHAAKASSIEAVSFEGEGVSASLYRLYGNVATPIQFIAENNSCFLLRGALYFDFEVDPDSVAPIVDYLEDDVRRLVETLKQR